LKNLRKIKFIKKKFQTFFIFRFSIIILFLTCLFSIFIYWISRGSTTIIFKDLRLQSIPTNNYLLPSLISGLLLSLFITSILAITVALLYSHRISGPMIAFERIIKNIGRGIFKQKIILRKDDEWKETANVLNNTLSELQISMNNLKNSYDQLKSKVDLANPDISLSISKVDEEFNKFDF